MVFINYFTDTKESARQKIEWANVVYFTGGLPDRMMDRIIDFDLVEPLKKFDGVVVGYSAGAVVLTLNCGPESEAHSQEGQ